MCHSTQHTVGEVGRAAVQRNYIERIMPGYERQKCTYSNIPVFSLRCDLRQLLVVELLLQLVPLQKTIQLDVLVLRILDPS